MTPPSDAFFVAVTLTLLMRHCAYADETTCVTDHQDLENNIYFVCFCADGSKGSNGGKGVNGRTRQPVGVSDEDFFSLADFARNLSGALFAKSIYVTFR